MTASVLPRNIWKPLLVAAALGVIYSAVLAKLGSQWWTDENYSHGLLIPFIIGYILWSERDRFIGIAKAPQLGWGAAAVAGALLVLLAGTAGAELFLQRASLVLMLGGIVVYFWGWRVLRLMLVPLALLALAIPIPVIVFNKIAFPLQLFASRCAVWAMRLFDIPVLRQGNVIELMPLNSLTPKKLEVVEACSGIRSLMTLLTLAVVYAYFTHPRGDGGGATTGGRFNWLKSYGFWRASMLVLAAVPIAIITNALRVSGTGVLSHYYGTEIADGFFHSFSGWVVYIVAFLLLFALGSLLDLIGKRRQRKQSPGAERAPVEPTPMPAAEAMPAAATTAVMSVREADGSVR